MDQRDKLQRIGAAIRARDTGIPVEQDPTLRAMILKKMSEEGKGWDLPVGPEKVNVERDVTGKMGQGITDKLVGPLSQEPAPQARPGLALPQSDKPSPEELQAIQRAIEERINAAAQQHQQGQGMRYDEASDSFLPAQTGELERLDQQMRQFKVLKPKKGLEEENIQEDAPVIPGEGPEDKPNKRRTSLGIRG